MTFLLEIGETLLKMVIVGLAAYGGITLGRYLRRKKEEKDEK